MAGRGESSDPAMMELFRAELDTHLPVLGEGLLALEKDAGQPRLLEAMMRAAHSIKGAARIVGVEPAVRVAHVMEDCLVAAQKGETHLGAGAIDVLLRGVDFLTRVGQPSAPAGGALDELVRAIAGLQTGQPPPAPPQKASPAPGPPAVAVFRPDNLDREGGDRLRRELLAQRKSNTTHFILDLSGVREVDPAALALLALFARLPSPDGSGPRLEVVAAPPEVRRLFRLTRLDSSYALTAGEGG
jgi:two-component system sensor histidine kinase and response regulator WspE